MKKVTVIMYQAECGNKYQSRTGCVSHEKRCKCFSNPRFRACHSCKFNAGLVSEDGYFYRDCKHPEYDFDTLNPFNIPNTKSHDCINCPLYEPKEPYSGIYEKWERLPIEHTEAIESEPSTIFSF